MLSAEAVAFVDDVLTPRTAQRGAGPGGVSVVARDTLVGFTQHTYPLYKAEPVHKLIASYLERVYRGEIKRLIINAPPQIGKSEITSIRFPAWWLGQRPNDSIIIASYGATLAEDKSKQVRQLIESDEYQQVFPGIHISDDTAAADMWRLARPNRGGVKAAGVGGAITGFGAELGVIDDPIKDWFDGQSLTILEKVWAWFKGTFRTRLRQDAAIVLIMTRWNINDLTGKLLKQGGWELLRLPALAEPVDEREKNNQYLGLPEGTLDPLEREPGESVSPERFNKPTLEATKVEVGEIVYAGEYAQVPRAIVGGLFKRDNFNLIEYEPPNIIRRVRFWDLALSEKASADYTVGALMGITSEPRYILLDVRRYRIEWDDAEPELAKQIAADGRSVEQGIEGVFYQTRAVKKLLARPELHAYSIKAITSDKDKFTRALPFAARVGAGLVDVLRRGWTDTFVEELCAFPNGANDDQVDGGSGAYTMLDSGPIKAKTGRWA